MGKINKKKKKRSTQYSRESARVVKPRLVGRELTGQARASFSPGAAGYNTRVAISKVEAVHERDDDGGRRCAGGSIADGRRGGGRFRHRRVEHRQVDHRRVEHGKGITPLSNEQARIESSSASYLRRCRDQDE